MIEIAHEAPLSIMSEVRSMTDFDYCLVHLLEDESIGHKYLDFFKKSLLMGRKVILDNSIFELGTAFDSKKFKEWIIKLKPSEYIIPDVLEDSEGTIKNLREWFTGSSEIFNKDENGRIYPCIGVVQGKTYEELVRCYQIVDRFCDKIAISFDYSYYESVCPHENKLYSWMYGRQYLLERMLKDGIINTNKPHHLLGCALPQEGSLYKNSIYKFIESMDTSNPVVHGIKNIKYKPYGLFSKEPTKLFTLINSEVNNEQFGNIAHNVFKFRKFWVNANL